MKHLKKYKIFENHFDRDGVIETVQTIKDILLELSDDNWDDSKNRFHTEVETMPCRGMLSIYVYINKPSGYIRKDLEDIISRLSAYLEPLGYEKKGSDRFDGYQYKAQFVSKVKWDVNKHLIEENMKYLKAYKLFESNYDISVKEFVEKNLEIVNTTEDIISDMRDNGIIVDLSIRNGENGGNIRSRAYGGVCKVSIRMSKLGESIPMVSQVLIDNGDLPEDFEDDDYDELDNTVVYRRNVRINYKDVNHSLDHLNSFLLENGFVIDKLELQDANTARCIKFNDLEKSLGDDSITWINIHWIKKI